MDADAAMREADALFERFEWGAQPPPPPAALGAPADRPLFLRRMLQAFGVLLLIAVFRILTEEEEDDDDIGDPGSPLGGEGGMGAVDEEGGSPRKSGGSKGMSQNGLLLRFIKLFFRVSEDSPRGCFFTRDASARLCATPLFVALLVVEGSDLIFAAASIPASLQPRFQARRGRWGREMRRRTTVLASITDAVGRTAHLTAAGAAPSGVQTERGGPQSARHSPRCPVASLGGLATVCV